MIIAQRGRMCLMGPPPSGVSWAATAAWVRKSPAHAVQRGGRSWAYFVEALIVGTGDVQRAVGKLVRVRARVSPKP